MRMQQRLGRILLAAVIGTLTCAVPANAAENPVHWSLPAVPKKPLLPGAKFTAKLLAQIDAGWHLYALQQEEGGPIATEISLADGSFLTLGVVHASKPIQLLDPNFNRRVGLYVEKAEFSLPFTVPLDAPAGSRHTALHVRYQCCNQAMCLPPRIAAVDLVLSIKAK